MTLKQFLKPDWRKIVVFVFLFLILPFPMPYQESCCYLKNMGPCYDCSYHWTIRPISGILYIFTIIINVNFSTMNELALPSFWIAIILLILFSYLLSCLIVWIYDRFRKKKKEDYVHIKDVNMVMGQLEKWGKKEKKK